MSKAENQCQARSISLLLLCECLLMSILLLAADAISAHPVPRQALPDKPDEFFLKPDRIADTVFHLVQQDPSAWTFELDLRPFGERF